MFWTWFFYWWLPEARAGRAESQARLEAARADCDRAEAHLDRVRADVAAQRKGTR